jgi:hypothetical protein
VSVSECLPESQRGAFDLLLLSASCSVNLTFGIAFSDWFGMLNLSITNKGASKMSDKKTAIDKLTPQELAAAAAKYNTGQAEKKEEARRQKRREQQKIYDAKRKTTGKNLTYRLPDAETLAAVRAMLCEMGKLTKAKSSTIKAEAKRMISLFQKMAAEVEAVSDPAAKPPAPTAATGKPQEPQTSAKPLDGAVPAR